MGPMWEAQHPPGLPGGQKQRLVAATQMGDGVPLHCQHAVRREGWEARARSALSPKFPVPPPGHRGSQGSPPHLLILFLERALYSPGWP